MCKVCNITISRFTSGTLPVHSGQWFSGSGGGERGGGAEEREEEIGIGHLGKGVGENPNKLWGQRIPVRDCEREREERGRSGNRGGAAEGGEVLVTERKPT